MVVCGIIFTRFVGHRRLREAVTRLAADRLIVLSPRRGYAVTSLQSNEILEIFKLRAVVEEHAAYRVANARTREDVIEVERILKASEAINLQSGRNIESWLQLNYEFSRAGSLAPAAGITLRGLRDCCGIRSSLTSASKST
jgi:DNA-binding GntR family transcriptional regulator